MSGTIEAIAHSPLFDLAWLCFAVWQLVGAVRKKTRWFVVAQIVLICAWVLFMVRDLGLIGVRP